MTGASNKLRDGAGAKAAERPAPLWPAGRVGRRAMATLALIAAIGTSAESRAADTVVLRASYAISIATIVVGKADAQTRFNGEDYSASLKGSTSGVTRLIADTSVSAAGTGRVVGTAIIPASYNLKTVEGHDRTTVDMAMRDGKVTDLLALPRLSKARDRIPVKAEHKVGIVDPLSAFMIPLDQPGVPVGARVCNRTVRVFDGWQRYDIDLYYKETKAVDGSADMYAGRVIVCGAHYIPIAGHRANFDSVKYMAANDRLEVWFVPAEHMPFMLPYRILIGTKIGDLVIQATHFAADARVRRAAAN
jgi:hypothetical protein